MYSSLPQPLCTEHVDKRIPTEDREHGLSRWPIWHTTTPLRQFRIIGKQVHDLPLAMTVDLGKKPININCHMGMVTRLHSNHFQALRSFISSLHSTWHTVRNLPLVQGKNIQVMGHCGKDINSAKVVKEGLKHSPLRRFQNKGHYQQVLRECL